MMWRALTVFLLVSTWWLPTVATAEVIPPGKEAVILGLFSPYGIDSPADDLGSGALLSSVAIEKTTVVVTVEAGSDSGTLIISSLDSAPEGLSGEPRTRTRSFALWQPKAAPGAVQAGLDKLAEAIDKNDQGTFWASNSVTPEPPPSRPSMKADADAEPEEPTGPLGAMAYLIFGLLLLLLLGSAPTLVGLASQANWKLWVALVLILIIAAGARLQMIRNVPLRKVDPAATTCQEAANCDDGNACTRDVCEVGECINVGDKTLAPECCEVDTDCPDVTDPCEEAFCNLDINRCTTRGACGVDAAAANAEPTVEEVPLPPSTVATWIFTAMGFDAQTVPLEKARPVAVVFSVLGLLFLAFFLLANQASPVAVLATTFLAAVFPSALVTVGAAGSTNLVFALMMLSLLGATLYVRGKTEAVWARYMPLGLFVVAAGALAWQRPEYVLVPVIYLALFSWATTGRRWPALGAAAVPLVLAAIQLSFLLPEAMPYAVELPLAKRFEITMHALLITGQAVPFLLVLAAMLGLLATNRQRRALPFIGLIGYLAAFAYATLLAGDALHVVRLTLPLTLLLTIPAAYGVEWIASRPSTYARLCVAIIIVYFALFPLVRRNKLFTLAVESDITELDRLM